MGCFFLTAVAQPRLVKLWIHWQDLPGLFSYCYSENSIIANRRGNSFNLGLLEKINNCLMLKKLNPARILEIHESLVDLLHDIIKMCRSLSGKPNHHNLQSSQRNLILQNCYSKSFKTKRSQKSSQTCHFNSTFVINRYFTDFFCQWKSTKI